MFDIEAGDWIVSTNVSDDANDNVERQGGLVDCEVYNSEANALARQALLLALADSDAVPDPTSATGFKHNKVKKCKRKQLVGLLGKDKAHAVLRPE